MKLSDFLTMTNTDVSTFADRLGVTKAAVGNWLRGERIPRSPQMAKILSETNGAVTPNDFHPSPKHAEDRE